MCLSCLKCTFLFGVPMYGFNKLLKLGIGTAPLRPAEWNKHADALFFIKKPTAVKRRMRNKIGSKKTLEQKKGMTGEIFLNKAFQDLRVGKSQHLSSFPFLHRTACPPSTCQPPASSLIISPRQSNLGIWNEKGGLRWWFGVHGEANLEWVFKCVSTAPFEYPFVSRFLIRAARFVVCSGRIDSSAQQDSRKKKTKNASSPPLAPSPNCGGDGGAGNGHRGPAGEGGQR